MFRAHHPINLHLGRDARQESTAARSRDPGTMGGAALALGAAALGAIAVGALAIGAVAIGRLAIGRARIRRLEIDELVVRRLRIIEALEDPPSVDPES
jgi:hypothetical protein